jgi:hypothetical protein
LILQSFSAFRRGEAIFATVSRFAKFSYSHFGTSYFADVTDKLAFDGGLPTLASCALWKSLRFAFFSCAAHKSGGCDHESSCHRIWEMDIRAMVCDP